MQLEHSFTVPVGIDDAWKVLLDIERIAPCMPGAALDTVDGDDFTGTVKVKLGPIGLTYKGKASFIEKDETAHRAVINAQGRDARGNGTAAAKVTATLTSQGDDTKVEVVTDLDITGKPAQFGRGVMADVGNKLIGQFADCLAGKLSGGADASAAEVPAAAPAAAPATKKTSAAGKAGATKSAPAKSPAKSASAQAAPAQAAPAEAATQAAQPRHAEPEPDGAAEPAVAETAASHEPAPQPAAAPSAPRRIAPTAEVEPIDLLGSAGPAVVKRLAPLVAGVVVLLIILRLRRK